MGGWMARSQKRGLIRDAAGGTRTTPCVPRGLFYGVPRVKRRLPPRVRQIPRAFPTSTNPIMASMAPPRQPPGGSWNGGNRAKTFVDPLKKGAGVPKASAPRHGELRAKHVFDQKNAGKATFFTPERGGVLTPHSPILTFSSSIPQRRPRPEMAAGGCRGRSLQQCSSGGIASFPPASRGSMPPGRGRVGALRASWRAGWWVLVDLFGFFVRLAWLWSIGQG